VCLTSPALVGISRAALVARADAAFRVLADPEATDFAAIAARLIATTDTPGAASRP